ncbi:hypothetical protein F2Q68_00008834 [Brassica cretica]|uniref:Uncharacterized protein n=1 Tax=Brassica cretica TaxID=69181 RepID=A0A8S9KXA2_BRACR|nr:hypothetical protein F2Q68_00008834 [Brassica cretica]
MMPMYAINKQRSLEVSTGEQSWIRDCPEGDSERVIGKARETKPWSDYPNPMESTPNVVFRSREAESLGIQTDEEKPRDELELMRSKLMEAESHRRHMLLSAGGGGCKTRLLGYQKRSPTRSSDSQFHLGTRVQDGEALTYATESGDKRNQRRQQKDCRGRCSDNTRTWGTSDAYLTQIQRNTNPRSTKQTMPPTNNLTSTTSLSLSIDIRDIPICLFGHQIWPRSLSDDTEMHPDVDLDAGSGRNPARTRERK